ncbi:ATP-binding protein [Streptomyces sp. NPDC058579]|uniref:sensor histidine kinase n=1 Tax=Streptomyces sp. NPDC058579 TaxID=3346548 RepID=UPI003654A8B7
MHEPSQEELSLASAVLDALPQAAVLLDPELRLLRVNRRFAELLRLPPGLDHSPGAPRGPLLDHIAGLLAHPEDRHRLLAERDSPHPVTRTAEYLLSDGRTLRRRRAPITVRDGLFGHLWLVEDVTRQRRAEEQLYAQVRNLTALAEERAAFAARTLHELRTPLATVLSLTELLLDPATGRLNDEQTSFVEAVHRNASRMRAATENLPKVAGGGPPTTPSLAPLVVHELVERVALEALQRGAGEGPYLSVDTAPGPPLVADGAMVTGVLEEIVENAVRYTPADGLIEVTARPDGDHWTVVVRDTGIGVPLEYQEEIFTPFVRAPNARRGGFPGTGLGLAVALDSVRLHGGTIEVHDREGPGAVFTVRLPLTARPRVDEGEGDGP